MNVDNIQNLDHALEVLEELKKINAVPNNSVIESYRRLHGGADTIIFELCIKNHSKKFVQRIFRPNTSNQTVKFEFDVQKALFKNNINVPQTYLVRQTPNTCNSPYYVMDKIEGKILSQVLNENPNQIGKHVRNFMQQLYEIHSIDVNAFPQIIKINIHTNPIAAIEKLLERRKAYLEKFPKELAELKPVFDWLENKKTNHPCKQLVVIHGDFHPLNIIVQENQEFIVIDWTGIDISDYRMDLGFATVLLNVIAEKNLEPMIKSSYEEFSGIEVENLDYFMILSNMYSLLRLYSMVNNTAITNENDYTIRYFKSVKQYPLYLVELVKKICNIDLKQVRDFFRDNY